MGRKKLPVWGVVAADERSPRDGRFIEDLGRYYPLEEPVRVELNAERVQHWLEVGAQPSDTVRSLLRKQGLLLANALRRQGASDEEVSQAVEQHRTRHADKAQQSVKLTPAARRQQALEEEKKAAAKREAEEAKARAEAEAAAAKAKAEAEAKARAEAKAKAEAKAEAEAAAEATVEAAPEAAEAKEVAAPEAEVAEPPVETEQAEMEARVDPAETEQQEADSADDTENKA